MSFRRTQKQQKKDQRYNVIEGVYWAIMFYLLTLFLVPYALYFGATPFQIGLLESLPLFVGSLFGLLSYSVLKHFRSKKQLCVIFSIYQVILCVLLGVFYFFISQNKVFVIIFLFILFNVFDVITRIIHTDWIGKLFVLKRIGAYTAQKQILLQMISIIPILLSGYLLDTLFVGQNVLIGFTILFIIAALSRLIGAHYLNKINATETREDIKEEIKEHKISLIKVIKKDVLQNKEYKFFLIVILILYFSIFMASPYFKYYFLESLGLSYFSFVFLHVITVVSTVLSLRYWGQINDKYGASKILKATTLFFPLYTLLLIFFHRSFLLLCLLNFFDGMLVGGFVIAIRTYFYQNTRKDLITHFSLFSFVQALGVILGTLFGGYIIVKASNFFLQEIHALWFVFAIATLFRIVAFFYVLNIKEKYHKDKKANLAKDILFYVPVRKGFNRFGRLFINYDKYLFYRMTAFKKKNLTKNQKNQEK